MLAWPEDASAQPPSHPEIFQAGLYVDGNRTLDCVSGPAGTAFRQYLWAWVPPEAGAVYLTIRVRFPDNVDHSVRPVLSSLVTELYVIDFGSAGVEWTFLLLAGCPTGWILLAVQDCHILDNDSSEIAISEEFSLARNCAFALEGLSVLSNLQIGTGTCAPVSAVRSTWGTVKNMYR